jgi:hypothetical protein
MFSYKSDVTIIYQERQCTYNVTMGSVRETTVPV